jgi:hypothetical protein
MTDPALRQLVESNARTAQAILGAMAAARLEREEARDQCTRERGMRLGPIYGGEETRPWWNTRGGAVRLW